MSKSTLTIFILIVAALGIASVVYLLARKQSVLDRSISTPSSSLPSIGSGQTFLGGGAHNPASEQRIEVREVKGVSFCRATALTDAKPLDCWQHLIDGDIEGEDGTLILRNGGAPYAVLTVPDGPRPLTKIRVLTDTNIGKEAQWLKSFRVETSLDGKAYVPVLQAVKSKAAGFEDFPLPSATPASFVKVYFDSNYGDRAWTQAGEVEIYAITQ